jgi:erythromycin esterase
LGEKVEGNDYWMMIIDNLIKLNLQFKYRKADYWKSYNLRDEQMASNLKWLCEIKYPDKKIIIWAANYHISKYNSHYPEDFLNNAKTMGAFFTADSFWNNRAYIIGFTSYGGKAGRLFQKKYDVPKPISLSFENWINKEYNYSFTDFRAYNSRNPDMHESFFMAGSIKGNALHTTHKAEWNNIFDGVFFIRNMYPCERIAK